MNNELCLCILLQRTGHSTRTFGRFTHDAADRRATLPGTYDPVVERELRALGSRPPGPHLDPTNPARQAFSGGPSEGVAPIRHLGVEPLIRASHANLARPVQGSEESVSVGSDYYGSMFSLYRGRTFSMPLYKNLDKDKAEVLQASKSSGTGNVTMTPKLARAGNKIFDKVLAFEERRRSVDLPGGAASVDSDDSGKKTGGPSKEGKILQGVSQKRTAFQQRASSLEDKTTYSQRVQSYQNKFADELQRIKKLVGKSSLKKAYSTEQLSQKERIHTGKIEPIPQHVVRKLEANEQKGKAGGKERDSTSQHPPQVPALHEPPPPLLGGSAEDSYLSADEEPGEGPKFVKPLNDTTAPSGSEVKLDCIITGSPAPTVTWRKNNVELCSDAFYTVKREGEIHTLLIKKLRPHNAGLYCVTAANTTGTSSCSATLHLQPGENSHTDYLSSPVHSDEEYLSSQEEEMEIGDSPSLDKGVFFNEPPSFEVAPCDQDVPEGQEVVIAAKIRGHPKPMVSWLKDRVTVKTGGRFVVRAMEDGTCEMRISSAQRSDAGLYVCKISSECETNQVEVRVEVRGEK
uniref:Ig-like domain-containing protein n=1 Tax=Fundulus heteroclitus TaxID=8078 RepID=A0A3Q2PQ88_FUNHE